MRARLALASLLLSVAPVAPGPGLHAQAVKIDVATLRRACGQSTADSGLRKFCDLGLPFDASGRAIPAVIEQWAGTRVPTIATVRQFAARDVVTEGGFVGGLLPFNLVQAQGVVITGLVQHGIGRARETVSIYVVRDFTDNVCKKVDRFISTTCDLLEGDAKELLGDGVSLPSWSLLQTALRQDLDALPDTVIDAFEARGAAALAGATVQSRMSAERLVGALAAARFARTYLARSELSPAFLVAANSIARTVATVCPASDTTCTITRMPTARAVLVATSFLGVIPADELKALANGTNSAADTRELLAWTLKAIAVNVREQTQDVDPTLRSAWTSFSAAYKLGRSDAGLEFDIGKIWTVAKPLVDSLTALQRSVSQRIKTADRDKAKVAQAYVDGIADGAMLLLGLDSATSKSARILQRVARFPALRAEAQYGELLLELVRLGSDIPEPAFLKGFRDVTLPPTAARAMQFAVDAAEVKDADGFQKVIAAYASPVDGFLRKRTTGTGRYPHVYWSLNMYVGGTAYAKEKVSDASLPGGESDARYTGLALPLGLEFGARTRAGGFGLLLQVADLGQAASWRTQQGASVPVDSLPKTLTFGNVYAPGINFVYNAWRWPIAVGAGIAKAPRFRAVDVTSGATTTTVLRDALRRTIFVAVDVPLLP